MITLEVKYMSGLLNLLHALVALRWKQFICKMKYGCSARNTNKSTPISVFVSRLNSDCHTKGSKHFTKLKFNVEMCYPKHLCYSHQNINWMKTAQLFFLEKSNIIHQTNYSYIFCICRNKLSIVAQLLLCVNKSKGDKF